MTRERIVRIGIALAILSGLLVVGLFRLSVQQRDEWLERSYMNRWAFRDVPTRRGDIVDRQGRVLVHDVPGFDLELLYRSFRRKHPVAIALHGGNLVTQAVKGEEWFRFTEPGELPRACAMLLDLPLDALGGELGALPHARSMPAWFGEPSLLGRDLRFYASSLVASLGSLQHSKVARILWRAVEEQREGTVRELMATELGEDWFDPEFRFGQSLDRLRALRTRLATIVGRDGGQFDLWAKLEERREQWLTWIEVESLGEAERAVVGDRYFWRWLYAEGFRWDDWRQWLQRSEPQREDDLARYRQLCDGWEAVDESALGAARDEACPPLPEEARAAMPTFRDESRPRMLRWRLPYRFAAWLGSLREEQPGFLLRPSVVRERGALPGRDDLGSLGLLIGRVTSYWAEDELAGRKTPRKEAERVLRQQGGGLSLELPDDGLAEELEETLRASTDREMHRVLQQHYSVYGRVGRSGVEKACDEELSGMPGLRFVERSKQARERRMFDRLDVTAGRRVELSIDIDLQVIAERIVAEELRAEECGLVAIDAWTGEVLAMAGSTLVEEEGELPERRPSLTPIFPRFDASIGSVVKPFVALEYLESLRRNPELKPIEQFRECDRKYGHFRSCGGSHWGGSRDVVTALGDSCNFFFFEVANEIGRPGLWRGLARVGWTGEDWVAPEEGSDREIWRYEPSRVDGVWQQDVSGVSLLARPSWDSAAASRYVEHEAIGYEVKVPALFIARAYAALATGYLPEVGLVRAEGERVPLGVPRSDLDLIRRGLRLCVETGTGRKRELWDFDEASRPVYGKTGTAVVRSAKPRLYNAWFAGFLGTDQQASIVVVAVGYHATMGGGDVGGVMFRRFLEAVRDGGPSGYLDGSALRGRH